MKKLLAGLLAFGMLSVPSFATETKFFNQTNGMWNIIGTTGGTGDNELADPTCFAVQAAPTSALLISVNLKTNEFYLSVRNDEWNITATKGSETESGDPRIASVNFITNSQGPYRGLIITTVVSPTRVSFHDVDASQFIPALLDSTAVTIVTDVAPDYIMDLTGMTETVSLLGQCIGIYSKAHSAPVAPAAPAEPAKPKVNA